MVEEDIKLRSQDGTESTVRAKVLRIGDGARVFKGTALIVGGCIAGLVSILIPILHLISVWAIPLVGIIMGRKALRTRAYVYEIEGNCPACAEEISVYGGPLHDTGWHKCPRCEGPFIPVVDGVDDPRCSSCDYVLRDLTGPACPECGISWGAGSSS